MLRKPVLGWATIATSAVPPAELAMVSTRIVRAYFFLRAELLRLFFVVSGCGHDENPIGKASVRGVVREHL